MKHAKVQYFRAKGLDVRLANDLSAAEKNFLCKRRKYVAPAVKKVLQLQEELQDDEVGESGIFFSCFSLVRLDYVIWAAFVLAHGL